MPRRRRPPRPMPAAGRVTESPRAAEVNRRQRLRAERALQGGLGLAIGHAFTGRLHVEVLFAGGVIQGVVARLAAPARVVPVDPDAPGVGVPCVVQSER